MKTVDNQPTAHVSVFSDEINRDIGDPETRQSVILTAIPEIVEPFPDLPGEGCFIATAAWGYYSAPQVQVLRDFRDRYLLTNKPGRLFVDWYYTHGPHAADYIRDNPAFKPVVRILLYPLILFSEFLIYTSLITKIFVSAGLLVLMAMTIVSVKRKAYRHACQ
jgi:hypothetical protein